MERITRLSLLLLHHIVPSVAHVAVTKRASFVHSLVQPRLGLLFLTTAAHNSLIHPKLVLFDLLFTRPCLLGLTTGIGRVSLRLLLAVLTLVVNAHLGAFHDFCCFLVLLHVF